MSPVPAVPVPSGLAVCVPPSPCAVLAVQGSALFPELVPALPPELCPTPICVSLVVTPLGCCCVPARVSPAQVTSLSCRSKVSLGRRRDRAGPEPCGSCSVHLCWGLFNTNLVFELSLPFFTISSPSEQLSPSASPCPRPGFGEEAGIVLLQTKGQR